MPVDTREKRAATTGIHLYAAGPGVTNAVAKDDEWRKEVGYAYPLVAAAAGAYLAVTMRTMTGVGA